MQSNHTIQQKSNQCQSQKLQNLWQKIQDLSQVQDQSRNQQIPMFFSDNSISKKDSFYHTGQILCNNDNHSQIQNLNFSIHNNNDQAQECKIFQIKNQKNYQPQTQTQINKKSITTIKLPLLSKDNLYELNLKLIQDNKKLFNQCIRLRKQFIFLQKRFKNQYQNKTNNNIAKIIQEENNKKIIIELNLKIILIQKQNKKLKKKINKDQQIKNQQIESLNQKFTLEYASLNSKYQMSLLELKQLKIKLEEYQKQSEKSISSTTHQSKNYIDKQRVINNMKIIHESELKKLKFIIKQQQNQINQLKLIKR